VPKITEYFNFGDNKDLTQEELLLLLQRMYTDLATSINRKPDIIQRNVNGQISDTFLANGDININLSTNTVEMLTNHPTQTTVTWTLLS
jgi:hypothetical protein